jgi:hypothetical protein
MPRCPPGGKTDGEGMAFVLDAGAIFAATVLEFFEMSNNFIFTNNKNNI